MIVKACMPDLNLLSTRWTSGGCGKAELLEKNVFFLFDCFQIFQTDFLPDFLTHKFGVTISHFLTLPKVYVTFPKCGKSVKKC